MPQDDAEGWTLAVEQPVVPPVEAPKERLQDAATQLDPWATAIELAAEPLHAAMRQCAAAGLPAPEVGFELADGKGQVLVEAELAWPTQRVAVLYGKQAEKAELFEQSGWRTYSSGDNLADRVISSVTV